MRPLTFLSVLLLFSGFAFAQATVIGGTAGSWQPAYGVYAAPYVPLVVTPSLSLSTYSPLSVGASNATGNLVAGATDSTFDSDTTVPHTVDTVPTWYGPTPQDESGPIVVSGPRERGFHRHGRMFQSGSASFQGELGLAQMAGLSRPAGKAARTITNADIDHLNQTTGQAKWDGKTEQLP
jgi:hypothetical protein